MLRCYSVFHRDASCSDDGQQSHVDLKSFIFSGLQRDAGLTEAAKRLGSIRHQGGTAQAIKGPRGDSIDHAAEPKAPEACGDEKESDKGLPSNKKQWEDSIDDTNADHTPGGEGSTSADPCSNAPWKKRKGEPTAAYFLNSSNWRIFEEVDREPPCNAGVWFYGKDRKGEPVQRRCY